MLKLTIYNMFQNDDRKNIIKMILECKMIRSIASIYQKPAAIPSFLDSDAP
jgi:hypothetical protein